MADALTILAIDDNPDNLITLQAVLADALPDCRLSIATGGKEGLELAAALDPHVILLDIIMPVMDGYEVCRLLKRDPRTLHIPVIFLTALKAERENRMTALEAGAEGFLTKPLEETELIAQIRTMAKIKAMNLLQRRENERLELLVTERTRALKQELTARLQAERNFESLFREMFDGFALHEIICNQQGRPVDFRFIDVNPAYTRLTGLSADKLIGNPASQVFPAITREWVERVGRVALTGAPDFFEGLFQPLEKYLEIKIFCPGPRQFACVLADITEKKRAEAEREKLQAQLNQAQKLESIGLLAGGVAHDFNNNLSVILGYTEVLLMQTDPAHPLFPKIQEIEKATHRSAALTRQLLAFARKQAAVPQVLDLNSTIEGMLKMLQRLIGEEMSLVWQPAPAIWPIRIDPGQVDQILANLAVNARDAIPDRGKITIATENCWLDQSFCRRHPGTAEGEYVLLAVADTGSGMAPEILAHIFEPFFTTKALGRGTGLGLATVFGIVKQNNGAIDVESRPGEGTFFRIYLPRYAGVLSNIPSEGAKPQGIRGSGETILLVEDDPDLLGITRDLLDDLGYTVLTAATPNDALRRAEAFPGLIYLLITDVVMPEMNGQELVNQFLQLRPNTPYLYISGYTFDAITQKGLLCDGLNFLQKPFSLKALAAKVRKILGAHSSSQNCSEAKAP
jgi:PAS domain S-box-containing protein